MFFFLGGEKYVCPSGLKKTLSCNSSVDPEMTQQTKFECAASGAVRTLEFGGCGQSQSFTVALFSLNNF